MKRALPLHSNAVWPPVWAVATFVIICGLLGAAVSLLATMMRVIPEEVVKIPEITGMWNVVLALAAGSYAAYRLARFHPFCNRGYQEWLTLSPWTADKPLPLGPGHLVWQDVAVVGALAAIAGWYAHVNPLVPAGAFGLIYGGGMTFLLGFTRSRSWQVLAFLWPALLLPAMSGWPMIGLSVALLAVIWLGYQESLKRFPWRNRSVKSFGQIELQIGNLSNVGWPYTRLSPKFSSPPISITASLLASVLIGWWCYCIIVSSQVPPMPEIIVLFGVGAAFFRLLGYFGTVTPSFNVWGRLVTGRFIVPGFDKVLLTPLAAVLLAIAGCMIIRHSGTWWPVVEASVVALLWFVLLAGGPTHQNWILTGQHRYRIPPRCNANRPLSFKLRVDSER